MNESYEFELSLLNRSIEQLTVGYDQIEEEIQADIIKATLNHFKKENVVVKGDVILLNMIPYQISFNFDELKRIFNINIIQNLPKEDFDLKSAILPINKIGRIRCIDFIFSKSLKIDLDDLAKTLTSKLEFAYLTIETSLKSKIKELEHAIVRNLYEILDIQLTKNLHPNSIGNYWYSITKISNKEGHGSHFSFFFNSKYLNFLIDKLKHKQFNSVSPIEMIFSLIFTEAPDDGIVYFEEKNKNRVDLEIDRMTKMNTDYHKFWFSEKAIFGEDVFSFNYIHVHKGYLLAINYPQSHSENIENSLSYVHNNISSEFEKNIAHIGKRIDLREKYNKVKNNSKIWEEIKDWTSSFIAKLGAEMMK